MSEKDCMKLNDRIHCWMRNTENQEILQTFSADERNILNTIYRYKVIDDAITRKLEEDGKQKDPSNIFLKLELESEISMQLKEQFICQINMLMSKGMVEAWMDIMAWYSLLKESKCVFFWEFSILKTMIDVFVKEINSPWEEEGQISVLSLRNMQELTNVYFKVVFLCRRIEFGVEPVNEIIDYINNKKLSYTFIQGIVEAAWIFDKKKVMKIIEERCWK